LMNEATNAKEVYMRVEEHGKNNNEMRGDSAATVPRVPISLDWIAAEPPFSDPITVEQARELTGLLDETCVELLRQIVLGDGSITWPQVQAICGIEGTDFGHYHYCYGDRIEEAVQAITQRASRYLITYEEGTPAWDTDDWQDVTLEIDGAALMSLREVLAS